MGDEWETEGERAATSIGFLLGLSALCLGIPALALAATWSYLTRFHGGAPVELRTISIWVIVAMVVMVILGWPLVAIPASRQIRRIRRGRTVHRG